MFEVLTQLPIWAWMLITWLILLSVVALTDYRKGDFVWGNLFLKGFTLSIVCIPLGLAIALSLTSIITRVTLIIAIILFLGQLLLPIRNGVNDIWPGFSDKYK